MRGWRGAAGNPKTAFPEQRGRDRNCLETHLDPVETAHTRCRAGASFSFQGTRSSPEPTRLPGPQTCQKMLGQPSSVEIEARHTDD